jgi:hypothetical protein
MRKNLLFVLAAVLLTAVIFSTATADGPGPGYDPELAGPCICPDDVRIDEDPADGICDICLHCIPLEDGSGNDED